MELDNATDIGLNGTDANRTSTPIFTIGTKFIETWSVRVYYDSYILFIVYTAAYKPMLDVDFFDYV